MMNVYKFRRIIAKIEPDKDPSFSGCDAFGEPRVGSGRVSIAPPPLGVRGGERVAGSGQNGARGCPGVI